MVWRPSDTCGSPVAVGSIGPVAWHVKSGTPEGTSNFKTATAIEIP